jgi:hypothetical protein
VQRAERLHFADHILYDSDKFIRLACRDPVKTESVFFDPELLQHPFQQMEPAEGFVISFLIMTVTGMATEDHHPVGSGLKSLHDELRIDPSGAHDPDDVHIVRINLPRTACSVSACIRTPVAEETHYLRFEFLYCNTPSISA